MRWIAIVLAAAALSGGVADARLDRSIECEKILQKIKRIESEMRAGYTRARGERLARELRELRVLRARTCG